MSKEELENIKNELDELMISMRKKDTVPDMQKVFFDNEKPIVYMCIHTKHSTKDIPHTIKIIRWKRNI